MKSLTYSSYVKCKENPNLTFLQENVENEAKSIIEHSIDKIINNLLFKFSFYYFLGNEEILKKYYPKIYLKEDLHWRSCVGITAFVYFRYMELSFNGEPLTRKVALLQIMTYETASYYLEQHLSNEVWEKVKNKVILPIIAKVIKLNADENMSGISSIRKYYDIIRMLPVGVFKRKSITDKMSFFRDKYSENIENIGQFH